MKHALSFVRDHLLHLSYVFLVYVWDHLVRKIIRRDWIQDYPWR